MGGTVNKMGKGNMTSILQRRIHKTKNMKKIKIVNIISCNLYKYQKIRSLYSYNTYFRF